MLPFLEPRKIASGIIAKHIVVTDADAPKEDSEDLKSACSKILKAIEQKSVDALVKAFQDAFLACEKYPHEEGPHLE